jgi:hypothetical protein
MGNALATNTAANKIFPSSGEGPPCQVYRDIETGVMQQRIVSPRSGRSAPANYSLE